LQRLPRCGRGYRWHSHRSPGHFTTRPRQTSVSSSPTPHSRGRYRWRKRSALVSIQRARATRLQYRSGKSQMRKRSVSGCVVLVCLGGCIHRPVSPPPQAETTPAAQPAPVLPPASEPTGTSQPQVAESSAGPAAPAPETQAAATSPSAGPTAEPRGAALPPSLASTAAPRASASSGNPPLVKNSTKPSAAAPATAETSNSAAAATGHQDVSASPSLDLASLEQRLRDTHAIGVFTKLSLKNQVDDLLAEFRVFHRGQSKITLAELRQRYELLLLKVVSLLQDGDAQLAAAVSSSREAIWGILVDPRRFAQI